MSLDVAANHLAAHGRHGDSTLVHMSNDEVAGLQALARSKGKTLTRNPHTGLPEAFNLGQELSNATSGIGATATGAALALAFPGLAAWQIGAGIAATNYAATGGRDPTRSALGGVGGFGGASIATSLANASGVPSSAAAAEEARATTLLNGGTQEAAAANAEAAAANAASGAERLAAGASNWWNNPSIAGLGGYTILGAAALPALIGKQKATPTSAQNPQMIRPYKFDYNPQTVNTPLTASYQPGQDTSERKWFAPTFTPLPPYQAADGGIIALAGGGPVEQMSNENAIGANTGFPQANLHNAAYATPYQMPISQNVLSGPSDTRVDPFTGEERMAAGGLSDLGGYSDGGRLLRGPGDGVSDSIPAQIGQRQPARLADGEFVVPARIVSELGNGSTEAGARQLYKMMDRVQSARGKTTGKHKVAKNTNAAKYLPA